MIKQRTNKPQRQGWEWLAIISIVVATLAVYAFGASKNGYANSFYAAAVQAGTHSWKAFFFGSLDASNYITVDKPPFALWTMEISTRLFGFHPWSMWLPNVLLGGGTTYLVYATVRRWFSAASGLLAAGVMALSPVAAMMFGFNNPDAALTFLLTLTVYAFVRAIDSPKPLAWLTAAGVATGCAFNTKMLQGLIVLPILALAYLVLAPPKLLVRLRQLLVVAVPTAIATLWWPVVVSLVPAANRPYIGSSTDNNIWNLIFGYNGLGRLFGSHGGQAGGTVGGAGSKALQTFGTGGMPPTGGFGGRMGSGMGGRSGFGGSTGILRMFNGDFGPNIGWLIPLALLGLGLGLWLTRRAPRASKTRLAFIIWGGWLVLHAIIFSITSGTIHPYYPVVMAPAVAALVGMSLPLLIQTYRRGSSDAFLLPLAIVATGVGATTILGYTNWLPILRWTILGLSLTAGIGLLVNLLIPVKRLYQSSLLIGALACAAGPISYTLATVRVAHTGSIPTAGPSATALQGSNNEAASAESALVTYLLAHRGNARWLVAVESANQSAGIQISSGQPVMAIGGFNGSDSALTLSQFKRLITSGALRYYAVLSQGQGRSGMMGGNSEITNWIIKNATVTSYGGSQYSLYDLDSANI